MSRKRVRGVAGVRRMFKAFPPAVREEIVREYQAAGPLVLRLAKSGAPHKTGGLRGDLSFKVYPKSLRLVVGLIGKAATRRRFYGYILEVGRKAQTVRVNRRAFAAGRVLNGGAVAQTYSLRVRGIPSTRFDIVRGRIRRYASQLLSGALNKIYDRAVRRLAGIGESD